MGNISINNETTQKIIAALRAQKPYRDKMKADASRKAQKHYDGLMAQLSSAGFIDEVRNLCAIAQAAVESGVYIKNHFAGDPAKDGDYVGFFAVDGKISTIGYKIPFCNESGKPEYYNAVSIKVSPEPVNGRLDGFVGPVLTDNGVICRPAAVHMEHFLTDWPAFKQRFMTRIRAACAEIDINAALGKD